MRSVVRRRGMAAAVLAVAMFASACGSSGGTSGTADGAQGAKPAGMETGLVNLGPDVKPVQGGSITMATYSEARSLDAAGGGGSGPAGGTELNAIYDVLVRWDVEKQEYVPQLAKALDSDDGGTTWTLTLRDGVEFSDGTPLNAQAVTFSINRHIQKNGARASLVKQVIASMDTPDEHTVVFHLSQPWTGFPWLLAYAPGNIVSPTAVQRLGDDFAKNPVGAGPFMLERFAPGEEIRLKANENYWNGRPYLDELRFVTIGGAQANYEAFNAGQAQVAYLRDPEVFRKAVADERRGFITVSNGGGFLLLNNGVKGQTDRSTTDVRVRRAVAAALDPEVIDARAYGGAGLPGSALFQEVSTWSTETPGPKYDPDKAKELLAAAKKDGYDGQLTVVSNNTPASTNSALAIQAMLNAVGFEVTVDTGNTVLEHIQKVMAGDFDLATYGANIIDEEPWAGLATTFETGSTGNQAGYSSPEMDALLAQLSKAADDEAKQQVIEAIQQQLDEDAPVFPYTAMPEFIVWNDSVHGIVPTTSVELLFDKAFIEKQ